ncbi:MAG: hypothetical protein QGG40_00185 [Myxococcota bacterium]|jgi:hypothetical protein|nr:hypothetical protein [Myxococcota bacterium]
MHTIPALSTALFIALLPACSYTEVIPEVDLEGKIQVPREAVQLTLVDDDGNEYTIDDPRALGPVYVGTFPSINEGDFDFPHPEMGPIVIDGYPGDTYPYGGTTVGRFDWGCYESIVCKMVSGRYDSFEDILEFHNDVLNAPVLDASGDEVTSPDAYRERCYDALYITSDEEMTLLSRERDFELVTADDGTEVYETDVTILQTGYEEGMSVWGWIDMPSPSFNFVTCDPNDGESYYRYSEDYYKGTNYVDLLNYPSLYIDGGDWVAQPHESYETIQPPVITDPDEPFTIRLGYSYED